MLPGCLYIYILIHAFAISTKFHLHTYAENMLLTLYLNFVLAYYMKNHVLIILRVSKKIYVNANYFLTVY